MTQTKTLLHRFDLRARKGLGQNFLIDEEVLKAITTAAGISRADVVMEIGPGLGILTRELAGQAGLVIAVELDDKLATILKQTMASFRNVAIVNKDILEIEPEALLQEQKSELSLAINTPLHYRVVANLPYYITSPVLRHFLEASLKPELMVLMVQREVAETIVADKGKMSLLSVSVHFYGKPEIVRYVPASCFYPVPKVDSAILKVTLYPQPAVAVTDRDGFFRLVRAGFSAARKQIANSLSHGLGLPRDEVLSLLIKAGIEPQHRAENLTLGEWARLWQVFAKTREGMPHVDS